MSKYQSGVPSVVVLTNQPSPYQVEFMNALARDPEIQLKVVYLYSQRAGRQWIQLPREHCHLVLDEDSARLQEAESWFVSADLAVIAYYRDHFASHLLSLRARLRKPWCFWGERMGVSSVAWLGPLVRRWKMRALHESPAAIWGIGEFALSRYKREFGAGRTYCNVPYYSDLGRFATRGHRVRSHFRTILFSGSLIRRKGVDTLATAFREVARELPHLRLVFLGDGVERQYLESQLSSYKQQVNFVGFHAWSELPNFYIKADLLCIPSRHDGWGLVVPEGLAAGLPVIGTDRTGAVVELIRNEVNGWIVPNGDVSSLAEALRKAASLSVGKLEAMSRAAIFSVANHQLSNGVQRFKVAVAQSLASWREATGATML